MNSIIEFIVILFGYLFLSTGISKISKIQDHMASVHAYKILPSKYTNLFSWGDVVTEIIIGITLLTGSLLLHSLIVGLILLIVYTFAILINLLRGRREIDCGCGGILGRHNISYKLIIRNSLLILLLLFTVNYFEKKQTFFDFTIFAFKMDSQFIVINLIITVFFMIIQIVKRMRELHRHLNYLLIGGE